MKKSEHGVYSAPQVELLCLSPLSILDDPSVPIEESFSIEGYEPDDSF